MPVLPAIFDANGGVDVAQTRQVAQFARAAGAHGVVFPGVASEFNFLDLEERGQLVDTVGEVFSGLPFVVGASANSVDDVVRAIERGQAAGATAAMVMAPTSVGSEVSALVDFFSGVAVRTDVEIVLQNAPPPVGSGLSVETTTAVARAVPAITYIKEETLPPGPRISALIAAAPGTLRGVIGGAGARHLYDELDRGAVAAMPAVEIVDLHVALFEAFQRGDRHRAREIYVRTLPLLLVQLTYRMRLTKHVLALRGITKSMAVRAPLPEFDEKGLAELEMLLGELSDLLPMGATA
ncbi:MAG TPA: dihydrodipicolinate synthase family protein [Devosia sp.]|nr:dihydrodipicolinate synthase family protein [Devosia sp.]